MNLVKTSVFNGIAVIVKMLTMLGLNKILAIYVGPSGYAALGQFQNAIQVITTFASGAINTGVTKYTAEYQDDELIQRKIWQTSGTVSLVASIICSFFIMLFNKKLAVYFFSNINYGNIFIWFACTLIFFVFNSLLLSILNGKKEVKLYVVINIIGNLFSLLLTGVLTTVYGLQGALIALAIYQSLSFIVTVYIFSKINWFKWQYLFGAFDQKIFFNLAKYTTMALTSAMCVPVSQIFIRKYLNSTYGLNYAGYWEALSRISSAYLLFITTTLSLYYLPRLSELKNKKEIKAEIIQGYKIILPFVVILSSLIFFSKDLIISLLFTPDFYPLRGLVGWQMLGDTLKVASWVLAFVMLGQSLVKMYIFTEIFFSLSFYLLTVLTSSVWGFQGVAISYALNYLLYFLTIFYLLRVKGFFK